MTMRCPYRRLVTWPLWLILTFASLAAAQNELRHVLVLRSYGRGYAPHDAVAVSFRDDLSRQFVAPIDFIEVSLQPARVSAGPAERPILDYLHAALVGRRLDLVVAIGGPAAVFAQKYRGQLFPATPMVLTGVDRRFVQATT